MKIAKAIYNLFSVAFLVILVGLVVALVGVRLLGFTPYVVLSGSMEPLYEVGSIVYVKEVSAEDIEVGDSITFIMSSGDTVVTHQVIEIDEVQGLYYTQGLANDSPDGSPVSISNILGKVYFSLPYLGYVADCITSPPWTYLAIAAVFVWAIGMYIVDISKKEDKEDARKKEQKRRSIGEGARKSHR